MDFNYSEDQTAIRDLAAQIFGDRASDEHLLAFSRTGEAYDESLWSTLAEQGLLGIAVPESAGGNAALLRVAFPVPSGRREGLPMAPHRLRLPSCRGNGKSDRMGAI